MIQHKLEVDSLAIPGDDICAQHENKAQTVAFLHTAKSEYTYKEILPSQHYIESI